MVRLVLHLEGTDAVKERYHCRRCDKAPESFRAVDNRGRYAHLCGDCMGELAEQDSSIKTQYVRLSR